MWGKLAIVGDFLIVVVFVLSFVWLCVVVAGCGGGEGGRFLVYFLLF